MAPNLQEIIEKIIAEKVDEKIKIFKIKDLSGGCINNALQVETSSGKFFLKYNLKKDESLFATEAKGLRLLKSAGHIHIPEVVAYGSSDPLIYLILEFVEPAAPDKNYWENFGASLAHLHKNSADNYGLHFNNFIGSLPQSNTWNTNWIDFFMEQRIEPMLRLAFNSGKIQEGMLQAFQNVYTRLPDILVHEKPSLLHGDLWSGNVMINSKGLVTLIDPAVYYGHREMEIAFTQLFGGFDPEFYSSYMECFPIPPGYQERLDIYNLYPLLVHVNLFGGGYVNSVNSIVQRYF